MANVAEVLVETLNHLGVRRIYGIVGDSLNGITNALQYHKEIEWVHVRHEESGAFAAGAEAQLTGELSVCAGSCGPGNLHLINGLYDCHRSRAPVLAIAAHVPSPEVGSDYFQETHPNILFQECSCFCEVVSDPEQMPRLLNIAIQTAKAKSDVAVLVISGDVALRQARYPATTALQSFLHPKVLPPATVLNDIATRLNESQKITVFCGIGAAEAHDELMQLCHLLQAPVVHTLRAKPFIEPNNPYDVGMTGFIGFSSGYYAMEACDTLLLLGTDLLNPNFAHLAEAVGMKGIKVDSASQLLSSLREALMHQGPVIVDVAVDRNELIIPPTIMAEQLKGFSLYLMKAIINGQGNAVLDLMKTNLWRSE